MVYELMPNDSLNSPFIWWDNHIVIAYKTWNIELDLVSILLYLHVDWELWKCFSSWQKRHHQLKEKQKRVDIFSSAHCMLKAIERETSFVLVSWDLEAFLCLLGEISVLIWVSYCEGEFPILILKVHKFQWNKEVGIWRVPTGT